MTQEELSETSRDELIRLAMDVSHRADEEHDRRTESEVRLAETAARLAEAEQQLRWFKNQIFGTKSEREWPEHVLKA